MGICAAKANLDITKKMEAEVKANEIEIEDTATPEIPSKYKTSRIKTNLSEIPDLTPVEDGTITPLPTDEMPNMILSPNHTCLYNNSDSVASLCASSLSIHSTSTHSSQVSDTLTVTSPNNDTHKVDITFNSAKNEITLNISNEVSNKKWIKILKTSDLSVNNEAMVGTFSKMETMLKKGSVECVEFENGLCQINVSQNEDTYEFVTECK